MDLEELELLISKILSENDDNKLELIMDSIELYIKKNLNHNPL